MPSVSKKTSEHNPASSTALAKRTPIVSWSTVVFGTALAILLIAFFFIGAVADRLFVFRPITFLTNLGPQLERTMTAGSASSSETSRLGEVIRSINTTTSVADVVEIAGKSVVTVAVKTQQPVYQQVPSLLPGFNFAIPSGQVEEIQQDIGTGFVVDSDNGFVVTNKHVVATPNVEYKIIDIDNNEYLVTNLYRDPVSDLAILKVENLALPALPLGNSDQARVGDSVIAIGTALGEFRNTVTTGVISGMGRGIVASSGGLTDSERLENVIQTDAAINMGNSGGPLISFAGEVIGVNVAMTQGAQNIAFSIPINVVKSVMDNFNQTGQFERAQLGVQYEQVSSRTALLNNWPQGAYVTGVVPNSAAARAGIQEDDIIFKIDGESLQDQKLSEIVNSKRVGETVVLTIWRNGEEMTVSVPLGSATAL